MKKRLGVRSFIGIRHVIAYLKDRVNLQDQIERIFYTLSALASIATGVACIGLVALGVITAATAGAALAVVGEAAIVLLIAIAVYSIKLASEEREVRHCSRLNSIEELLSCHAGIAKGH